MGSEMLSVRSASSSRHPRTRSIESVARGGPARCTIRSCPCSARCRTAERAPRYWSIDTTMGLRRCVEADAMTGTPSSSPRTISSTPLSMTISTIPSTRSRNSASTVDFTLAGSSPAVLTVSTRYRATRAAMLKCIAITFGPWSATLGAISPMVRVRLVTSDRAWGEGLYRSWAIARSTRSRVAARTLGDRFSTRETVWWETPASRATSKMLGARSGLVSATFVFGLGHGGTRNQREELVDGHVGRAHGLDDPAVLEDCHTVTDAQHLLEL